MLEARVTGHDGTVTTLDEAGLAGYGIVIVQNDLTPTLEIYSTDTSWITSTFEITISSTVVEETTWSNYATIVINYSNPSVP